MLRASLFVLALFMQVVGQGGEGPRGFDGAAEPLGRFLPLAVKDGQLSLDGAFDLSSPPTTTEEEMNERTIKFVTKSFHPGVLERLALYHAINNKACGKSVGSGGGAGGPDSFHYTLKQENWNAGIMYNPGQKLLVLMLSESAGKKRSFSVNTQDGTGVMIRLAIPEQKLTTTYLQTPTGEVVLSYVSDGKMTTFSGKNFSSLSREYPTEFQAYFFGPLNQFGIQEPLMPDSSIVVAVALSAFSNTDTETEKKAEDLIRKIGDEQMEVRETATQEMLKLYPRVIYSVSETATKTTDEEVRSRLNWVKAHHPELQRVLEYVRSSGLQNNKEYLLKVLSEGTEFKTAARTRLTQLYGKDFGMEVGAWPKP